MTAEKNYQSIPSLHTLATKFIEHQSKQFMHMHLMLVVGDLMFIWIVFVIEVLCEMSLTMNERGWKIKVFHTYVQCESDY